jgi:ribose/xylose/arabinose/galactoside ABC-type transport system permease subunit
VTTVVAVRGRLRRVPAQLWVACGLTALCLVLLAATGQHGLSADRLLRILSNAAPLGVVAIAQTIVIINRGIDLSVGPMMNAAGLAFAVLGTNMPLPIAVVLVVGMGAMTGLVNGIMFAFTKIAPLLGTLAMATVIQGIYSLLTHGQPKGGVPASLRKVADTGLFGSAVTGSLLVWITLLILTGLMLSSTVAGRRFFAVGTNPRAARLAGVPVRIHTLCAYVASGTLAAVAGVLLLAYSGSPTLTAADSYALDSVVAAVIGGAALAGGTGGMVGTFAGVSVLALLSTVLTSFDIPSAVRYIVNGSVLVIMLLVNGLLANRKRRS